MSEGPIRIDPHELRRIADAMREGHEAAVPVLRSRALSGETIWERLPLQHAHGERLAPDADGHGPHGRSAVVVPPTD